MPTLTSAREQYLTQQQLVALAVALARRAWSNQTVGNLATGIGILQLRAAQEADTGVAAMLDEQNIDAPPAYEAVPASLAGVASDGRPLQSLLDLARALPDLEAMASTQVADVARVQRGISTATRPKVGGYIRTLTPPTCGRCAVLAGKFYRWSDGFERHPRCDCINVPTNRGDASDLVADPEDMARKGQLTDLSVADTQAVRDGADLGQVVNIRRRAAGIKTAGGRVLSRGDRLTPEGIYQLASDRTEALTLLRRYGYIK